MEIVYKWVVSAMDEVPKNSEGLDDVVIYVYWRREGVAVVGGKSYISSMSGCYGAPAPSPEDFTPYDDLTFDQVCGWLDAGLNVEGIDQDIAINIQSQMDPPVISLPLPWDVSPSSPTTTSTTTSKTI